MALVIDANMRLFAERMNITSSRMVQDYGLSTVDEIIEEEAKRGNTQAINYAKKFYHSPDKLIKLFRLTDVENKFRLIKEMDHVTQLKVLPMLEQEDLVMGLYFFTQDKLLEMLMEVDIEELVRVAQEAFPIEYIIMMMPEEELAKFMLHDDLERRDVMEQIKAMPPEILQKFIEGVTGMPMEENSTNAFFRSIETLADDDFKKFMSQIDPDVQRQLTFQLTKQKPEYLTLFSNECYVNMLSKLDKPDMVKPMIMLSKDSLIEMNLELPDELMAIVAAQIDTEKFAKFLQKGHMDVIEKLWMI